ncbi:hypothetical protein ACET3Z_031586 [Daucus carota]
MNFANLAFRDLNRTNPCIIYVDSDGTSSTTVRIIIVSNMLPLHAQKDGETEGLSFNYDEDFHLIQWFFYVGSLNADIDVNEHEVVVERLMDDFNCVHTFLANELFSEFYHGFCKYHRQPIFHYMLPMCGKHGDQFDQGLWQAYISANKILADKVLEVANPETNYILIHDYHLMAVLVFLRNKPYRAKLGFFLQSPFLASAEIYRTLPEFIWEKLKNVLNIPSTSVKVKEFEGKFKGKHVIVGVDDMNLFKAISLKLLAFQQLLRKYENLRAIVVLVQIINPERSSGEDIEEVRREKYGTANRINQIYGSCGHQLVSLIDRPVDQCEKNACYAASECCIVNAVRDGMTLVLHMYIICGQGSSTVDEASGIMSYFPRTSVLIIYEYVGCSPSLSGAIRINSWDISSLAEAMHSAVTMDNSLRQLRHEQNYSYVQSHDVAYMARSFLHSMERACLDHYNYQCWGLGFSFTFKVAALSLGFQKLFFESIVPAYKKTNRRAVFLDFDGTLVPHSSTKKNLSSEVVTALNTLCDDPKNTVFIVSGRGRSSLTEWLDPCEGLGLAAEHGYFIRWKKTSEWQSSLVVDLEWKDASKGLVTEKVIATMVGNGEIPDFILCIGDDSKAKYFVDDTFKVQKLLQWLANVSSTQPSSAENPPSIP